MRKLLPLLLILTLLAGTTHVSAQQNRAYAELYPADVSAFPKISTSLDVFDTTGIFASGLKPDAVSILEDGTPLPVDSLKEVVVPLQLVVAVNQGESLGVRDSNNLARFDRVAQIIAEWAAKRPADIADDYSLVSQAGPVINHASAADFVTGLNGFKPDFRAATPNLLSLSIALDTVSAQTQQVGTKRAVLFITPRMDDPAALMELEALTQRAKQGKIRVFVWFVDLAAAFQTTSAAAFNNLALETGGSLFAYSGIERFPDPEAYFAALRRVYKVTYTSRVKVGGEHTISASIKLPAGVADSIPQKFSVDIQAPNPFALTNDIQITRRAPEDEPFSETLLPASQELKIIIEFPDGHPRPLTRTTLYVDGVIMDENTAEPFDTFTWDLSTYASTGEHQIMVEAVDSLGLQKTSVPVPITVTVVKPLSGGLGLLAKYRTQLTFGAIIIAGLALFLILISGRLRMPSLRAAQAARRAEADPLTQSVRSGVDASTPVATAPAPAVKTPKVQAAPKKVEETKVKKKDADAMFMRLAPDGQVAPSAPILVLEKEITFGTDPIQCSQIMDDPSISSLHARLRVTDDGGYLLLDNNSLAGTWVNYEPLPREGCRLSHGDMIHFGQLTYRFTLKNPPETAKPKITPLPTDE